MFALLYNISHGAGIQIQHLDQSIGFRIHQKCWVDIIKAYLLLNNVPHGAGIQT